MFTPASINGWASFLPYDNFANIYDLNDNRRAVVVGIIDAGRLIFQSMLIRTWPVPVSARQNWVVTAYAEK